MAENCSVASTEARAGIDLELIKNLSHNEIAKVLSGGFCRHCHLLLKQRIEQANNEKSGCKIPSDNVSEEQSESESSVVVNDLDATTNNHDPDANRCSAINNDLDAKSQDDVHSEVMTEPDSSSGSSFCSMKNTRPDSSAANDVHQNNINGFQSNISSSDSDLESSNGQVLKNGFPQTSLSPESSPSPTSELVPSKHQEDPPSVTSKRSLFDNGDLSPAVDACFSVEQKEEQARFSAVGRKKDFMHIESINGKRINILQGLELHTGVFSAAEQKNIVDYVYHLQKMGQMGHLKERTYTEPKKWLRGKGRITIQFGCCYNYVVDKNGVPPGINRKEEVDPMPLLFKKMIKRMVEWQVLPPSCIPDSCIVNIYEEGDCIPPHVDHHDFLRPFCTVSFLSQCNILFGSNLTVLSAGEFSAPVSIPLPLGSVLVLNGNGADVAKHCVPGVPTKRISITFRKMDDTKLPYGFLAEPGLEGIKPVLSSPVVGLPVEPTPNQKAHSALSKSNPWAPLEKDRKNSESENSKSCPSATSFVFDNSEAEFPSLRSSVSATKSRVEKFVRFKSRKKTVKLNVFQTN